jgi:hypothetical protein
MATREVSLDEFQRHDKAEDCWITVDGRVLDVSKFAAMHPGGKQIIQDLAGQVRWFVPGPAEPCYFIIKSTLSTLPLRMQANNSGPIIVSMSSKNTRLVCR